MLQQIELARELRFSGGYQTQTMVCWVDYPKKLRAGWTLRLDKDDRRFKVIRVYQSVDPKDIKRGWNNNI